MTELSEKQVKVIEDWVNSEKGCNIVKLFEDTEEGWGMGDKEIIPEGWERNAWVNEGRWNAWVGGLMMEMDAAGEEMPDEEFMEAFLDDMEDWDHNGNLYPWSPGETNSFGMTRWTLGEMGS